ncbi:hypothetical protein OA105_03010 [Prochlorococcus sp. AH-736-B08]|nr:hypothetical protein [Prochlorococcus sp. AH-736-B08]
MKIFTKNKFKILTGTGIMFLLSLVAPSSQVQANVCQNNPATFPNSCSKTPEVYKPRIYEMGFCKSDPLAGTTATGINNNTNTDNIIDESSCIPTFESNVGSLVNLAIIGQSYVLTGKNSKPPVGSYPYVYIILSNTTVLKGEQFVNNVGFYSSSDGTATKNIADYVEWENKVIDFEKGTQCEPLPQNRLMAVAGQYTTGVTGELKAMLAHMNNGQIEGTTSADCGISTHVFGSFKPTSPLVISESTKGLEINFSITDTGLSIVPWSGPNNSEVGYFSTGAFLPHFIIF